MPPVAYPLFRQGLRVMRVGTNSAAEAVVAKADRRHLQPFHRKATFRTSLHLRGLVDVVCPPECSWRRALRRRFLLRILNAP